MNWIFSNNGWKWVCAITYISICIFDFVIVPMWFGIIRASQGNLIYNLELLQSFDLQIQRDLIQAFTQQHQPFTLQGGGMFHLAFGALLTGSALVGNDTPKTPNS